MVKAVTTLFRKVTDRIFAASRSLTLAYPSLPDDVVIYAIGDIHGRLDCLEAVHRRIDTDRTKAGEGLRYFEIYLGDYIDRGPDSAGVIEALLQRKAQGRAIFLRGNHEQMLVDILAERLPFAAWRSVGGLETALSYGLEGRFLTAAHGAVVEQLRSAMPPAHHDFLRNLRSFFRAGDYFFVHAGVRPGTALDAQNDEDLLWIREPFLGSARDFGAIIVHGHTPVDAPHFLPNRINIDTGAFATGRLTCIRIGASGVSELAAMEGPRAS